KISFRTPDLRLDNAQTLWVGESATSAVPQIELLFNYRISPADLQDKLKIRSGNSDLPYTLITSGEDNKMVLRLTGIKAEDKDLPLELELAKGLRPAVGKNGLNDPIKTNIIVSSPYVVQISRVEAEHDGTDGTVRLFTSQ